MLSESKFFRRQIKPDESIHNAEMFTTDALRILERRSKLKLTKSFVQSSVYTFHHRPLGLSPTGIEGLEPF